MIGDNNGLGAFVDSATGVVSSQNAGRTGSFFASLFVVGKIRFNVRFLARADPKYCPRDFCGILATIRSETDTSRYLKCPLHGQVRET